MIVEVVQKIAALDYCDQKTRAERLRDATCDTCHDNRGAQV